MTPVVIELSNPDCDVLREAADTARHCATESTVRSR